MTSSRAINRRKTYERVNKKIPTSWTGVALSALQYKLHIPQSMEEVMQSGELQVLQDAPSPDRHLVCLAPFPLAIGTSRAAFYARDEIQSRPDSQRIVICKEIYIEHEDNQHKRIHESYLQCHRDAVYLATMFNAQNPQNCPSIMFTEASLLQLPQYCLVMEELIKLPFELFNNHTGYVAACPTLPWQTDHRAIQYFSHWTHQVTNGYLIIVGCRGGYDHTLNTFFLTTPIIHSKDIGSYGDCNTGTIGMEKFFRSHECNHYCRALGLSVPCLPLT